MLQTAGQAPVAGRGLLSGGTPCYGVYKTLDARHVAVGALEMKFWRRLCDVLARPQWALQHWSLGLTVGGEAAMALRDELAAIWASQPLAHWVARFESVDACVTPVLRLGETLGHPLFAASHVSTTPAPQPL
jgi:crotonobetainyl-CoA:carnitine CoA-transferase CaiB-like acyl-CoA transferase